MKRKIALIFIFLIATCNFSTLLCSELNVFLFFDSDKKEYAFTAALKGGGYENYYRSPNAKIEILFDFDSKKEIQFKIDFVNKTSQNFLVKLKDTNKITNPFKGENWDFKVAKAKTKETNTIVTKYIVFQKDTSLAKPGYRIAYELFRSSELIGTIYLDFKPQHFGDFIGKPKNEEISIIPQSQFSLPEVIILVTIIIVVFGVIFIRYWFITSRRLRYYIWEFRENRTDKLEKTRKKLISNEFDYPKADELANNLKSEYESDISKLTKENKELSKTLEETKRQYHETKESFDKLQSKENQNTSKRDNVIDEMVKKNEELRKSLEETKKQYHVSKEIILRLQSKEIEVNSKYERDIKEMKKQIADLNILLESAKKDKELIDQTNKNNLRMVEKILSKELGFKVEANSFQDLIDKFKHYSQNKNEEIKKKYNLWLKQIAMAETERVLEELFAYSLHGKQKKLNTAIIQQNFMWSQLKMERNKGVLNDDVITIQTQKINAALISTIQDLREEFDREIQ